LIENNVKNRNKKDFKMHRVICRTISKNLIFFVSEEEKTNEIIEMNHK
jgi:hypothetical protein